MLYTSCPRYDTGCAVYNMTGCPVDIVHNDSDFLQHDIGCLQYDTRCADGVQDKKGDAHNDIGFPQHCIGRPQ